MEAMAGMGLSNVLGATVRLRTLFSYIDTESNSGSIYDYAFFWNSAGAALGTVVGGYHLGSVVSGWLYPLADGVVKVRFHSDASNCCPNHHCNDSYCLQYPNFPYRGALVEGFEYQRYQTGVANPIWTPIRFPGQYYDAETDLVENWHRYYDPSIGRYLEPEPLLQDPLYITWMTQRAQSVPAYAYANSNPLINVDPSGLASYRPQCVGEGACTDQEIEEICAEGQVYDSGTIRDFNCCVKAFQDHLACKKRFPPGDVYIQKMCTDVLLKKLWITCQRGPCNDAPPPKGKLHAVEP
jgi:RHS repeat-associated protein